MSSRNGVLSDSETTENKILYLARALLLYSKSRNERLSQKTADVTIRIMLLSSKWDHILKDDVSKSRNQNFLEASFNFLFEEKGISGVTVRMQCFYYGRYLSRDSFKDHQKQILLKNCFHLLQKLKKVWHNATEDLKEMHNDLVKLILIKQGMENQEDHTAFDEMKAAVNSVFPPSSLSTFVLSNQKTKMAFINEVSSIAAGIRLHEWYSQKAGKYMFDVGKIMKETLPRVCEDLHEELSNAKMKIEVLQEQLKGQVSEGESDGKNIYQHKLLLIHFTSYYEFIKTLKENIDEIAVQTYKLDYTFAMQIKELNSEVKTDPFNKADRIYPTYKELAKTWKHMQVEGHLLNFYINLFQDLKKFTERIIGVEESEVHEIEDEEFVDVTEEKTIRIDSSEVKNFNEITLEYKEFCAFHCSMGILLPCNKDLGLLMFKNLCYGFSSISAMELFEREPDKCIAKAIRYMCIMPQLIFSLQMEKYFHFPLISSPKSKQIHPIFISESSVQTILHPIEKNLVYTYNWNQWDLRKQALKYVDLLGRKTHSTQTNLSHFRRENHSQVYLPKDNSTQTRRDASTTISRSGIPELYAGTGKTFITRDFPNKVGLNKGGHI